MSKVRNVIELLEREKTGDLGMQILVDYKMMPISDLRQNQEYQRMLEPIRKRRIVKSITAHGYWPQEVIILNELHEVIDGNHRVYAAHECGIQEIPVSIVVFPNKQLEAKFYTLKNSFNTRLRPVDFWHARNLSGHQYAKILYELESCSQSLFYNRIAIKGHKTEETKFTIPQAILITNTSVLNNPHPWDVNCDDLLTKEITTHSFNSILERSNQFLSFYFKCFGESKKDNPTPFMTVSIRAFCVFYCKLDKENHISTPGKALKVAKRVRTFVFTVDFLKADHVGKVLSFINHYNRRRKHRISYDVVL